MFQGSRILKLAATIMIVSTIGLLAVAAPIIPAKPQLTDEYRGLANIKQFRLNVLKVPSGLAELGLAQEKIVSAWSKKLTAACFKLGDDKALPTLTLAFEFLTDSKVPDGVVCLALLTVTQQVHFDRLNQSLHVPTYVQYLVTMEDRDRLENVIMLDINRMMSKFIIVARRATVMHRRGG